jgi:hypothetical protein
LVAEIVSLPVESSVAFWLLARSAALSWSRVLTVPLVPSPKVTLTAVPPLKEEKVKVLPERLPGAAVRPAVNEVAVPVLPVRPSTESALPVPTIDRSAVVPVEICSEPLELIEEFVCPLAVANGRTAGRKRRVLNAGGKIDRNQHVGDRGLLQIDGRVAVTIGLDLAADARAGRNVAQPGAAAFLNVMVLPLTFSVEPSWTSVPSEPQRWCGAVDGGVAGAEPSVRPSAFERSALPVMLRSAPVEVCRSDAAPRSRAVWPAVGERRRAGAIDALCTPLARSIAVSTSPTVAVGAVVPR